MGTLLEEWPAVRPLPAGVFASGSEATFWLPQDPVLCVLPGPYVALATVGPYSARLGNLSRSEIVCGGSRGGTQEGRLRAKYVARAVAICSAATARFGAADFKLSGTPLEQDAAWNEAAAEASEKALAKLSALALPQADVGRVSQIFAVMERQTDVLYQTAAAASAGNANRAQMLSGERVDLTHKKDELLRHLALRWGVPPDALYGCPVSLPA